MFRFSIRELMLVTLVAALGLAWWLDRSHLADDAGRYKEALMKLRRMGFNVGSELQSSELSSDLNATWEAEHAAIARKSPKSAVKKR